MGPVGTNGMSVESEARLPNANNYCGFALHDSKGFASRRSGARTRGRGRRDDSPERVLLSLQAVSSTTMTGLGVSDAPLRNW